MNREKNSYTIIYAVVMVVLVAVVLAFTAQVLKPRQEENRQIDKMQQILRSIHVDTSDKSKVIELFRQHIKEVLLVNRDGSVAETFAGDKLIDNDAFRLNMANALKEAKTNEKRSLPLYVAEVDGVRKYILPMSGQGLWGPIWGYLSLDDDCNTVYGSDFSHQGETPGLGAEIATPNFAREFVGKKIFKDNTFMSIAVVKAGQKPIKENQDYVDGISGGTLTSNGVNDMLEGSLAPYQKYLEARMTGKSGMGRLPEQEPICNRNPADSVSNRTNN